MFIDSMQASQKVQLILYTEEVDSVCDIIEGAIMVKIGRVFFFFLKRSFSNF